jgi:hypothetical protein
LRLALGKVSVRAHLKSKRAGGWLKWNRVKGGEEAARSEEVD